MARTIDLSSDEAAVLLVIRDLNVNIQLDVAELKHLARKAHENKNRRSKSGPCRAEVADQNRWPAEFSNRYTVRYEDVRPSERGPGTLRRQSGGKQRLQKAEAEALFDRYAQEGENTYVELWGPKKPNDRSVTVLKTWGTKAPKE